MFYVWRYNILLAIGLACLGAADLGAAEISEQQRWVFWHRGTPYVAIDLPANWTRFVGKPAMGYPTSDFRSPADEATQLLLTPIWDEVDELKNLRDFLEQRRVSFQKAPECDSELRVMSCKTGKGYWFSAVISSQPNSSPIRLSQGGRTLTHGFVLFSVITPTTSTQVDEVLKTLEQLVDPPRILRGDPADSKLSQVPSPSVPPRRETWVQAYEWLDHRGVHRAERHPWAELESWQPVSLRQPGITEFLPEHYRIPVPRSQERLVFPASTFVLSGANQLTPWYYFTDDVSRLNVSFNFEPLRRPLDADEIPAFIANWYRRGISIEPSQVSRIGSAHVIEYSLPLPGSRRSMRHMHAIFFRERTWIDVHLSQLNLEPKYRSDFEGFVLSIGFAPTATISDAFVDPWVLQQAAELELVASTLRNNGELDEVLIVYTQMLKLLGASPHAGPILAEQADALNQLKRPQEAMEAYRLAITLDARNPRYCNALAWMLATSPESTIRNGTQAVELATKAVELSRGGNANYLDTLAAAYAEQGDTEQALRTLERALQVALPGKETETLLRHRETIAAKQPIRQP